MGDLLLCRLVYARNATVILNLLWFLRDRFPHPINQKETRTNVHSFRSYSPNRSHNTFRTGCYASCHNTSLFWISCCVKERLGCSICTLKAFLNIGKGWNVECVLMPNGGVVNHVNDITS